ncbi:hypothetical protein HQ531_07565 [bacterium]|nr:hypothetical protein [bacterium]
MRLRIENEIKSARDVTHIFILTHNIDLIFLQSVLLPSVRKCGNPSVTVFAEYSCALESFNNYHQYAGGLGKRYRLVPVKMNNGFRFHPKAIFFAGKQKASLFIGSGNLGFGGWRDNAEIWNHYDSEVDGRAEISFFHNYLSQIADHVPLNNIIKNEILAAFDPNNHSWSLDLPAPSGLLGKVNHGIRLLDQMKSQLDNKQINKLYICAPYYDDEGAKIEELKLLSGEALVEVFVPEYGSNLIPQVYEALSDTVNFKTVSFKKKGEHTSFIHAKFYAFVHDNDVTVFSGSANCSNAALGIPGSPGNAELMAVQVLSIAEFNLEFIAELEILNSTPDLTSTNDESDSTGIQNKITILASRLDRDGITVVIKMTEKAFLENVLVDGVPVKFINKADHIFVDQAGITCNHVQIIVKIDEDLVHSDLFWIDHELELQKTAKHRSLADAVNRNVVPDGWTLSSWNAILGLFVEHLNYLPQNPSAGNNSRKREKSKTTHIFTSADVFISDYHGIRERSKFTGLDKITGLRALLIQLFGDYDFEGPEDKDDDSSDEEEAAKNESKRRTPENPSPPNDSTKPSKTQKKQSYNHLEEATDTICGADYYLKRSVDQIAHDITLLSPLLRFTRSEGLIDEAQFLKLSQKIWNTLFFNILEIENETNRWDGWFHYRTEIDGEQFVESFRDIRTSASLISWVIAPDSEGASPNLSLFTISSAMALAKYPWLYGGYEASELDTMIFDDLLLTKQIDPDNQEDWNKKTQRWRDLRYMGDMLVSLMTELKSISPGKYRSLIDREIVNAGGLVWLGVQRGFGVLKEECNRTYTTKKVGIYCLQTLEKDLKFTSEYILPIEDLIELGFVFNTKTELEKKDIIEMLQHIGSTVIKAPS